ncbi:hypothetical protein [Pedobacter arcticus]|uniref:hypothetical protein n=1 Tax=Pedobacter arcticus TaxID=752140 RepID=UPI0002F636B3|nr:hypothetical protein [Pedobacter arcticus]
MNLYQTKKRASNSAHDFEIKKYIVASSLADVAKEYPEADEIIFIEKNITIIGEQILER